MYGIAYLHGVAVGDLKTVVQQGAQEDVHIRGERGPCRHVHRLLGHLRICHMRRLNTSKSCMCNHVTVIGDLFYLLECIEGAGFVIYLKEIEHSTKIAPSKVQHRLPTIH